MKSYKIIKFLHFKLYKKIACQFFGLIHFFSQYFLIFGMKVSHGVGCGRRGCVYTSDRCCSDASTCFMVTNAMLFHFTVRIGSINFFLSSLRVPVDVNNSALKRANCLFNSICANTRGATILMGNLAFTSNLIS